MEKRRRRRRRGASPSPPRSGDPPHHLDAPQLAGPPLPLVAVAVEVIVAGQEVELDHAEHPVAVLDQHAKPGENVGGGGMCHSIVSFI